MKKHYAVVLLISSLFFAEIFAQPTISYSPTPITGLSSPVEIVNAGDGTNRLFIVQQTGAIRVYDPAAGGLQATSFLDVSGLLATADSEQGLLSLAFHPAYETNGYFFIYYNNTAGDITVARYQATGTSNTANTGSGQVLLSIPKPFTNHNGGHLQFAQDGTLFFATGDGGSGNDPGNRAQDSTSLLGKMLRIRVDNFTTFPYYTVPTDNPFYNNPLFDNRIWARGLRNPYRWSFDRLTGAMWIGDVGQGAKEEINYAPGSSAGGENYGWRCYEGFIRNPNLAACDVVNYTPPVFDYNNTPTTRSVVGGYVYRGTEYPFFNGYYIATDFFSTTAYIFQPNGSGGFNVYPKTGLLNFISGFGEGEDGTIYAVRRSDGVVYKVVASIPLPVSLTAFTGRRAAGANELKWSTASEQALSKFFIEYSTDGTRYATAGEVVASGRSNGSSYSFVHTLSTTGALFYRLRIAEKDGSHTYSNVVRIDGKNAAYLIYPTVVRDGKFNISSSETINSVQVLNSNGILVYGTNTPLQAGVTAVQLPVLAKGIYVVKLSGKETYTSKILIE